MTHTTTVLPSWATTPTARGTAPKAARPHGDPDVGGRDARRVVHPVANHRHRAAPLAKPADGLNLLLGGKPGHHLVYPDLPGHGLRRVPAVARQHHGANPHRLEAPKHARGLGADGVP